jgi:hypothetical protein
VRSLLGLNVRPLTLFHPIPAPGLLLVSMCITTCYGCSATQRVHADVYSQGGGAEQEAFVAEAIALRKVRQSDTDLVKIEGPPAC